MRNVRALTFFAAVMCLLALLAWVLGVADAQGGYNPRYVGASVPSAPKGVAPVYLPVVLKSYVATAPLWRFGVVGQRQSFTSYSASDIAAMRFGWRFNFDSDVASTQPYGIESLVTIRVKQVKLDADNNPTSCRIGAYYESPYTYTASLSTSQIQSKVSSYPGRSWVIGNEIERIDWGIASGSDAYCMRQDEILPALYAQAYHDIYYTIKTADSTAQVSPSSLVEWTPLRQVYFQQVWDAYKSKYNGETMPADFWTMHFYVLQEAAGKGADIPAGLNGSEATPASYTIRDNEDFTKVQAQIVSLRTWLKANGQQSKPLIINEYGVLYPNWVCLQDTTCNARSDRDSVFTPQQVRDYYMYPSFNYFLYSPNTDLGYPADQYRMVQRWGWWSLDYDAGEFDTNGDFFQGENGNLFYSGLNGANAQGISSLGTYWQQYVASLPAGSSKPYTSASTGAQVKTTVGVSDLPTGLLNTANCTSDSQKRGQIVKTLLNQTKSTDDRLAVLLGLKGGVTICSSPEK